MPPPAQPNAPAPGVPAINPPVMKDRSTEIFEKEPVKTKFVPIDYSKKVEEQMEEEILKTHIKTYILKSDIKADPEVRKFAAKGFPLANWKHIKSMPNKNKIAESMSLFSQLTGECIRDMDVKKNVAKANALENKFIKVHKEKEEKARQQHDD